jgi:hypothetical protein
MVGVCLVTCNNTVARFAQALQAVVDFITALGTDEHLCAHLGAATPRRDARADPDARAPCEELGPAGARDRLLLALSEYRHDRSRGWGVL